MFDFLAISIGLHIHSHHWREQPDYNNSNVGVYVRADNWQLGTYYNTYRKPTVYLGYAMKIAPHTDLLLGGATGYNYPVTPFYMVSFDVPLGKGFSAKAFVNHEVLNAGVEYSF